MRGAAGLVTFNSRDDFETYTIPTDVPISQSIWGVEYEPTTKDTQTELFYVSQLYYTVGSTNWDIVISVKPAAPPGSEWTIGYTIHYSYQ
jgi:hypothetical protein